MKIFKTLLALLFAIIVLLPIGAKAADIGKLAVTPSGYDDMKSVLTGMGFSPDEISWDDLKSLDKLKQYSAVYINCSGDTDTVATEAVDSLKQYVQDGGVIYASDWANSIIARAFPGKITFYNGGTSAMGARAGNAGSVTAKVADSGMAAVLGKSEIEVNFDLGSWAVMTATTGTTYFTGPAAILDISALNMDALQGIDYTNPQATADMMKKLQSSATSKTLPSVPYVVSFAQGKGEVLYTSFHNEAQNGADVAKVLNWFATRTQASSLVQQSRQLAKGSDKVLLEVVDSLNKDQTKTFKFDATGKAPFKVVLNFGGSSVALTIKDPNGKEVATQTVSEPPYTAEVSSPVKGKYSLTVEAKDIPTDNYPYVVTVLGAKTAAVEVQKTEPVANGNTSDDNFFSNLTSGLQKNILWLALAGIVFLILVVVIVLIKIRKPHPGLPKDETKEEPKDKPKNE